MATALRTIKHDDQLTLVEHLDELRTRLIISIVAFGVCFAFAIWQNDRVLDIVNHPFETAKQHHPGKGTLARNAQFQEAIGKLAAAQSKLDTAIAQDENVSPAVKSAAEEAAALGNKVAENVPPASRQPVTLGVAEPFT